MKNWLNDAIDQIAVGELLAKSDISCGQRFGFIAIDNAVEFMLIAYVEVGKLLVGGHITGGITKNIWRDTKEHFPKILSFVVSKEPKLSNLEDEITRFHNLRGDLYHTGKPRTVSKPQVILYLDLARKILGILFSITYNEAEWDERISVVQASVCGKAQSRISRRSVEFKKAEANGVLKYFTGASPSAKDAICLVLYGYSVVFGRQPERDELEKSLSMSGYQISPRVLSSRLSDLRREKLIRKNALAIYDKGKKILTSKYILT